LPPGRIARILSEVREVALFKLLAGLLKGVVIGGAVGYGAYAAGLSGSFHWLTYGACGALVGLVAGRPLWALMTDKNATTWVSVLKALFGFGVACGIYALVAKVWGGFDLAIADQTRRVQDWQPIFGAAIGGFWGAFIEIDDAIGGEGKTPAAKRVKAIAPGRPPAKPGARPGA
jgi:hypothetical protein